MTDNTILRGPVLDVYGSWEAAVRHIGDVHPYALRFQGWPENLSHAIEDARRRWPGVHVAICPGVDPVAKRWRHHHQASDAVAELTGIATRTAAHCVDHLVFDAEASWKGSTAVEREQLAQVATLALREIRDRFPDMRLYLTSYGWPVRVDDVGGHGDFPWRGWCDGDVVYIGQTYDRGHGHLVEGERIAIKSFEASVAQRMMAAGTRRMVEVQTHHNALAELVTVGTSTDATFWWAAGSTRLFDDEGAHAWRAALVLWRAGYWGDGAVERFQRDHGLHVDGVCGPKTLAAMGF